MVVSRYDWPGPALLNENQAARDWNPENQAADRQAYASALWKWAQDFTPFAASGFENDYPNDSKGPTDFALGVTALAR
jgi:hypothetical protein